MRDQQLDGSGLAGRSRNEPPCFECQDHLMYGWRRNSKVPLHLGLRGRASVDFAVIMDEGQVLALFIRKRIFHGGHATGSGALMNRPVPGQQFLDAIYGVVRDAREHRA